MHSRPYEGAAPPHSGNSAASLPATEPPPPGLHRPLAAALPKHWRPARPRLLLPLLLPREEGRPATKPREAGPRSWR